MPYATCDTVAVECNEGAGLEGESCTVFCKNICYNNLAALVQEVNTCAIIVEL